MEAGVWSFAHTTEYICKYESNTSWLNNTCYQLLFSWHNKSQVQVLQTISEKTFDWLTKVEVQWEGQCFKAGVVIQGSCIARTRGPGGLDAEGLKWGEFVTAAQQEGSYEQVRTLRGGGWVGGCMARLLYERHVGQDWRGAEDSSTDFAPLCTACWRVGGVAKAILSLLLLSALHCSLLCSAMHCASFSSFALCFPGSKCCCWRFECRDTFVVPPYASPLNGSLDRFVTLFMCQPLYH